MTMKKKPNILYIRVYQVYQLFRPLFIWKQIEFSEKEETQSLIYLIYPDIENGVVYA